MADTITPQDRPARAPTAPPLRLSMPAINTAPVLVASPHSGRSYTAEFVASSRLSFDALRRSEDSFVDDLFASAAEAGIPLLKADFPRVFCDVNREAWELDPTMFEGQLPPWCNTASARVAAGFGTIARLVSSGESIYRDKLTVAEAEFRIQTCWQPYHDALADLIDAMRSKHGACLLLDAHSMPSRTGEPRSMKFQPDPDFVLGDAFGTSCAQPVIQFTERFLSDHGYRVRRNDPYAGGYVTRHYGRPSARVHVLQIEICRSLYMNETSFEKLPGFQQVEDCIRALLAALASAAPTLLQKP